MKHPTGYLLKGFILFLLSSCQAQDSVKNYKTSLDAASSSFTVPAQYQYLMGFNIQKLPYPDLQVGEYVRRVFEDSDGNLWFGTNEEGAGRFNGEKLSFLNSFNGLSGSQVTAIMEDSDKNIWIATDGGISRVAAPNKKSSARCNVITNFTEKDGLPDHWGWSLYEDKKGTIWAGTIQGVSRFDGTGFTSFKLPATTLANPGGGLSPARVAAITEDKSGKLWFGTDGGGAYAFDGEKFTNYTTADGLCDNNIVCILHDSKGNLWFGSLNGGLSRFDGESFTNINEQTGIGNNEVWNIYEDRKGDIWFSSEGFGVYRYDGKTLTRFGEKEGLGIKAVQTIYEDSKGRLWIGGGGGLYRFDGKDSFFNVTRNGLMDGC